MAGRGGSDQRSFAHVIANLPADERAAHVKCGKLSHDHTHRVPSPTVAQRCEPLPNQVLLTEALQRVPDPIVSFKNWPATFEGDYLLHFPGTFCGLSPSGVYTDTHLLMPPPIHHPFH